MRLRALVQRAFVKKCSVLALLGTTSGWAASTGPSLIEAIKDENRVAVQSLIKTKTAVNAAQPDGSTPLSWAVYLNQVDVAEQLIAAGANVNSADEYGDSPLTLASATGNGALIEKLLSAGADPNAARWNGETALMLAARAGSVNGVKLLLAKGAKPNAIESRKGQNALMWAAAEGHGEIIDLLLTAGADPKTVTASGFTALVFAAQSGDKQSVEKLLAAGLDANYALPNGTTVLQVAVLSKKGEAAAALLEAGANANVADRSGITPLHVAAQAGDLELVRNLVAKKALVDARTAKVAPPPGRGGGGFRFVAGEQTPLLLAARANKESVMRALVAAGADPTAKAQDGTTILMAAASGGHIGSVKYAYELNPDVHAVTDRKTTVMHAAVTGSMQTSTQNEICKVIQFLADKGAALDEVDANNRTPITVANVLPIDQAVELLDKLITASGKTPKQSPKR
jgi:ankyrin repeat protein